MKGEGLAEKIGTEVQKMNKNKTYERRKEESSVEDIFEDAPVLVCIDEAEGDA